MTTNLEQLGIRYEDKFQKLSSTTRAAFLGTAEKVEKKDKKVSMAQQSEGALIDRESYQVKGMVDEFGRSIDARSPYERELLAHVIRRFLGAEAPLKPIDESKLPKINWKSYDSRERAIRKWNQLFETVRSFNPYVHEVFDPTASFNRSAEEQRLENLILSRDIGITRHLVRLQINLLDHLHRVLSEKERKGWRPGPLLRKAALPAAVAAGTILAEQLLFGAGKTPVTAAEMNKNTAGHVATEVPPDEVKSVVVAENTFEQSNATVAEYMNAFDVMLVEIRNTSPDSTFQNMVDEYFAEKAQIMQGGESAVQNSANTHTQTSNAENGQQTSQQGTEATRNLEAVQNLTAGPAFESGQFAGTGDDVKEVEAAAQAAGSKAPSIDTKNHIEVVTIPINFDRSNMSFQTLATKNHIPLLNSFSADGSKYRQIISQMPNEYMGHVSAWYTIQGTGDDRTINVTFYYDKDVIDSGGRTIHAGSIFGYDQTTGNLEWLYNDIPGTIVQPRVMTQDLKDEYDKKLTNQQDKDYLDKIQLRAIIYTVETADGKLVRMLRSDHDSSGAIELYEFQTNGKAPVNTNGNGESSVYPSVTSTPIAVSKEGGIVEMVNGVGGNTNDVSQAINNAASILDAKTLATIKEEVSHTSVMIRLSLDGKNVLSVPGSEIKWNSDGITGSVKIGEKIYPVIVMVDNKGQSLEVTPTNEIALGITYDEIKPGEGKNSTTLFANPLLQNTGSLFDFQLNGSTTVSSLDGLQTTVKELFDKKKLSADVGLTNPNTALMMSIHRSDSSKQSEVFKDNIGFAAVWGPDGQPLTLSPLYKDYVPTSGVEVLNMTVLDMVMTANNTDLAGAIQQVQQGATLKVPNNPDWVVKNGIALDVMHGLSEAEVLAESNASDLNHSPEIFVDATGKLHVVLHYVSIDANNLTSALAVGLSQIMIGSYNQTPYDNNQPAFVASIRKDLGAFKTENGVVIGIYPFDVTWKNNYETARSYWARIK